MYKGSAAMDRPSVSSRLHLLTAATDMIPISIGQYVLLPTTTLKSGKLYAAQITSRDGSLAQIQWYYGNIYLPKDTPRSTTYSIHRLAAAIASQRAGASTKKVQSNTVHNSSLHAYLLV